MVCEHIPPRTTKQIPRNILQIPTHVSADEHPTTGYACIATTRATMGLRWEPPRRYRDIRRSKSRGVTGELPSYSGMNKEASPDKAVMFLWHTTACLTGTPTVSPGTVVPLLAKALLSDWRYDTKQPLVDEDSIRNITERTNKESASIGRSCCSGTPPP